MRVRIIRISILSVFLLSLLGAKEPLLLFYNGKSSDAKESFCYKNYHFNCEMYGVLTLEKLYSISKKDSFCRKSIDMLYKKNPDVISRSASILKYRNLYHVELKGDKCVVYIGAKTLSEILLKEGLAVMKPLFMDEEFYGYFKRAEENAKIQKRNLWSENIFVKCIEELSK